MNYIFLSLFLFICSLEAFEMPNSSVNCKSKMEFENSIKTIQDNTGKIFSVTSISTLEELISISQKIGKDYRIEKDDTEQCLSCLRGISLDYNFTRSQIFSIYDGEDCIGIATLFVIPYSRIKDLIFFEINNEKLVAKQFSELFNVPFNSFIIEPGYIAILPEYRHKKLGEAIVKDILFPIIEDISSKSRENVIIICGAQGHADKNTFGIMKEISKKKLGEVLISDEIRTILGKARPESMFSLHQVQKYLHYLDGIVGISLGPVFVRQIK